MQATLLLARRRAKKAPLLAVWSKDAVSEAAEALGPIIRIRKFTSTILGNLALETHVQQIACTMLDFLKRKIFSSEGQVKHSLFDNGKPAGPSALE